MTGGEQVFILRLNARLDSVGFLNAGRADAVGYPVHSAARNSNAGDAGTVCCRVFVLLQDAVEYRNAYLAAPVERKYNAERRDDEIDDYQGNMVECAEERGEDYGNNLNQSEQDEDASRNNAYQNALVTCPEFPVQFFKRSIRESVIGIMPCP